MKCNFLKNSLHIDMNGHVFPCTMSSSNKDACFASLNEQTLEEIYNSRNSDNECRGFCARCLRYDRSYRDWDGEDEYYFLDLRFDNNCNFMCRTCHGVNSISFKKEDKTVKPYNIAPLIFKNMDFINKFKRIYIGGGEPFLSPSIKEFLQKLNRDKVLLISSNLSILKDDIIELLKEFKCVTFYPSIDGLNKVGEYIRHGFKNDIFFKNLETLTKHFTCAPAITVSALNLASLSDIITKLSEYVNVNAMYLNVLDYPPEFHISVLPDHFKELYFAKIKYLESIADKDYVIDMPCNLYYGLKNIRKALDFKIENVDIKQTIKKLKELDVLRNEDYKILFGDVL